MSVLLIDTSSSLGLCAVCTKEGKLLSSRCVNAESSHSEVLFGAITGVLNDAGIGITDLSELIYCAGPGSFTGLRISYSAVMGIATSVDSAAVKGVSALHALCHNFKGLKKNVCAIINSSPEFVFVLMKDAEGRVIPN